MIWRELDKFRQHWEEAIRLTSDLQPGQQFSTPQLVDYLNEHLPEGIEKMTKTKVDYLRQQDILHPKESGEGKIRISWRYTVLDARRAMLIELLKAREDLRVQESRGWLRSFETTQPNSSLATQELLTPVEENSISIPIPVTPVHSAYALLLNRILGTLITALGFGEVDVTPPECLIAIHVLKILPETTQIAELEWHQVQHC